MDALDKALTIIRKHRDTQRPLQVGSLKRVKSNVLSYTHRHRGAWFRPEYDFDIIQIAQDTDSYLFRAIQKKVSRFLTAGWELVGRNQRSVDYIKRRLNEIAIVSNRPFFFLMGDTVHDLLRFSNCMWVKIRDSKRSSGRVREGGPRGRILEPVAAYFVLPFETLEFKTADNGDIKKVRQSMPDGTTQEWFPEDVIHFYTNRKPGFSVGTPEIFPALDDIALLRRIEENVEELLESHLFPVFHYKVGNDQYPERYGPDGKKETDIVRSTLEYMPSGGIYISDHRHEIQAIGSEGRALRIDFYLEYFKKRVFSAIGVSPIDVGEGDTSNRSTAQTMSKASMMDLEALQATIKQFVEFYVINELLIEGGFDPLDEQDRVYIKFGVIDKEERRAFENNQIQLWNSKVINETELRTSLGYQPMTDDERKLTVFSLYEEPLALLRSIGLSDIAAQALAEIPTSAITPQMVAEERQAAAQILKQGAPRGRIPTRSPAANQNANKAMPANQHGVRPAAKTNHDLLELGFDIDASYIIDCDYELDPDKVQLWKQLVEKRYALLADYGVSIYAVIESLKWRLDEMHR